MRPYVEGFVMKKKAAEKNIIKPKSYQDGAI